MVGALVEIEQPVDAAIDRQGRFSCFVERCAPEGLALVDRGPCVWVWVWVWMMVMVGSSFGVMRRTYDAAQTGESGMSPGV